MFYSSGKNNESPPPSYKDLQTNSANGSSKQSSLQNSNAATADKEINGAVGGAAKPNPLNNDSPGYPLHECVFRGDVKELSALIRAGHDLSKVDSHGNSALHLAVMLGRRECVHLLCAHGAPVKIKNKQGWSPIAEAIR